MNCPIGSNYQQDAPWNQPEDLSLKVEVNVEVGTFVDVTIPQYNEAGKVIFNEGELQDAIKEAIKDKLGIDNDDIVLNDFYINNYK